MRLSLVTASTVEPLTPTEAKDHLRVSFAKEDDLIKRLIAGAREAFERDTGRQLLTASWNGFLDSFPQWDREAIEPARPPLLSVATVSYLDTSGVLQAWSAAEYTVEAFAGPFAQRGMVYPNADQTYPSTRRIPNAVTIDFDAGYGAAASDVPTEIREALLGWIGHHYLNRESVVVPWPGFLPWLDRDFA